MFRSSRIFSDRADGGQQLARKLEAYKNRNDTVVIALPRGGVVTGFQVASHLGLPLDIVVPRKIGAPHNPELAVGAITEDGEVELDAKLMKYLKIKREDLERTIEKERKESMRRRIVYRGEEAGEAGIEGDVGSSDSHRRELHHHPQPQHAHPPHRAGRPQPAAAGVDTSDIAIERRRLRPPLDEVVRNKTVILVDDGVATGATAKAAIKSLRKHNAAKIVVAMPVAAADSMKKLGEIADETVVVMVPDDLDAIGSYYARFGQTEDKEVIELLKRNLDEISARSGRK